MYFVGNGNGLVVFGEGGGLWVGISRAGGYCVKITGRGMGGL